MAWLRPAKRSVSSNIYAGMVTRNVTEPTYVVDDTGRGIAVHPNARTQPGYVQHFEVGGSQAHLPPEKKMLDRNSPPD